MWFYSGDEPELDFAYLTKIPVKARAGVATRSFEKLVVAHARGDDDARSALIARLNTYAAAWNGGDGNGSLRFDGDLSDRWIGTLIDSSGLRNPNTEWTGQMTPDDGGFTDVQAPPKGGAHFSIEVKAQFTKLGLGDVTQADYLTGYSDFLAHFVATNAEASAKIKRRFPEHFRKLRPRSPIPDGWSIGDLMLAELVGLYDAGHLAVAGIASADDLRRFAEHHYLLHAVGTVPSHRKHAGGARLIRFADFPLVRGLIAGHEPPARVKDNEAAVAIAFQYRDAVEYTIHVGYRVEALSKSKLHVAFFDGAKGWHIE